MYKHFFKPLLDFVFALIGLPFFILLFIPIAIAIKLDDGGPVFYCGKRLGRNGKPFKMFKFRSMKVNAPDIRLSDGSTYNAEDDERVTKVGRFLRKTSLDEIPQLLNILVFQMSFIGPRPDPLDWLEKYPEDEKDFLKLRPGVTGYSQAYYRNSVDGYEKIRNDNYYYRHISFFTDIKIILKTILAVLEKDNIFVNDERVHIIESKKLLIVGASILQVPAIKKAKEMGLIVGVVDYNANAVGIQFADQYYNCSTLDREGVDKVIKEFGADGVMTMATDMPMRTIAYVCKKNNLLGLSEECALNCTDKIEMIRRFKECNVPSPMFFEVGNIEELQLAVKQIGTPCILKPADNSGSRGVTLCTDADELAAIYDYVKTESRSGKILAEEYMTGPEVSVEVFVQSGIAHVLQITDKLTTGAPHFIELGHSQPTRLGENVCEQINSVAQQACDAVGLQNGPAHLEMIITSDGPKMVEMGARMGGDCITSHLVPLSTGINMTEQTIRYSLGLPLDLLPKYKKASAVIFLTAPSGRIVSISHVKTAYRVAGVQDIGFFKQAGDECGEIHSSSDRVGFIVAQRNSAKEAISACQKAAKRVKIKVVRGNE